MKKLYLGPKGHLSSSGSFYTSLHHFTCLQSCSSSYFDLQFKVQLINTKKNKKEGKKDTSSPNDSKSPFGAYIAEGSYRQVET